MTFDNANKNISKHVLYGDTIHSRAITFNFTSDEDSLFPRDFSNFECSLMTHLKIACLPSLMGIYKQKLDIF